MTSVQSEVYVFVSQVASPVSLADMKLYLKITNAASDALIQSMIDACTKWGEKYTGRDFRAITWQLLMDCFPVNDRILIKRDPVATITSIKYLLATVETTVTASEYYLKKNTQNSEVLLFEGNSWPSDVDNREQAITVDFVTAGYVCQDSIIIAIKRHVADLYSNRGDCGDDCDCAAGTSGIKSIYGQFRITRV